MNEYKLINKYNLPGFTLLELIVVIAIITILAVIAIPSFNKAINEAKVTSIKANMKLAMQEIMKEQINNGGVVPGLQGCSDDESANVTSFSLSRTPIISSQPLNGVFYKRPLNPVTSGTVFRCNASFFPYVLDSAQYPNVIYSQKYFDIIQNVATANAYLTDIYGNNFFMVFKGKEKFANYIYLPNYKLLCVDNQGQIKEYNITNKNNFYFSNNSWQTVGINYPSGVTSDSGYSCL